MRNLVARRKSMLALGALSLAVLVNGLYCYSFSDSKAVLAFSLVLAALAIASYIACDYLRSRGKLTETTAFALVLCGLGVLYIFVFTPFTVPDEPYHFQASYKLSDYLMFLSPASDALPVRADDAQLVENSTHSFALSYGGYNQVLSGFSLFSGDPGITSIVPQSSLGIGSNPPQIKLASALGITLARLLNLGSYPLFYLGRLSNFAFFAALVIFAVKTTPVGKRAMMAVAILPMTLHVAGSYSYDAGIIGLAFCLTALCLKAICGTGRMSRRNEAAIAACAVLLAPCKVIYSLLVLLVLFIPAQRFSSKRMALVFKFGVLAGSLLAILVLRLTDLFSIAGVGGDGALNVRGSEQGHYYTAQDLLGDPLNTVLLFLRSFDKAGDFYLSTSVGGSLAWFQANIAAPWYFVFALWAMVVFSSIKTPSDAIQFSARRRVAFASIALVGWLLVMTSMALGWTFTTETVIQGAQGRYFLPLLPLLLISLQGTNLLVKKDTAWMVVGGMLLLNVLYMQRTFALAVSS